MRRPGAASEAGCMNTTSWAVRARGLGVSGRTAAVTKAIETGALPAPGQAP